MRVSRIVLQVSVPQNFGNIGHAHGSAGVSRLGFFNGVDR
jgi:hypothetical protein